MISSGDHPWSDQASDSGRHAVFDARSTKRPRANGHAGTERGLELVLFVDLRPRLDGQPLIRELLEREQTSVIYGEAGCGKTFLALDIALHIAAGLEWFGRKVAGGAVVYCACEAGRSIANRVEAFKRAHGYDDDSNLPFAVVTSPIDLCHPEAGDVQRLVDIIRRVSGLMPVSLLIIDTVSRALAGGNENAPDDMGSFVRSLDRIRDELRCHVAAVHHAGKDRSRGSRGHSLLHCAVDTEIQVIRDDAAGISTAIITKQRDGSIGHEFAFRLRPIEIGRDRDGEPVTSCVVDQAEDLAPKQKARPKLSAAQVRALELLTEAIARDGKVPSASSHIPPNTACVTEALWREYCGKGAISSSDKPDSKLKAFKRAARELIAAGQVSKWDCWVWAAS
jgi:KaiC/GvpD/RAD55 family RecA-like ATPase